MATNGVSIFTATATTTTTVNSLLAGDGCVCVCVCMFTCVCRSRSRLENDDDLAMMNDVIGAGWQYYAAPFTIKSHCVTGGDATTGIPGIVFGDR